MPINTVLEEFRSLARANKADLGNRFERLTAAYLRRDPLYAQRFSQVWLWGEWPYRWGSDDGIDVVAQEAGTDNFVAIQCKFFDPERRLDKGDIDSFFTASGKSFDTPAGKRRFAERFIFATTEDWTAKAQLAIENQNPPVTRVDVRTFDASPIDWNRFSIEHPDRLEFRPRKSLRPHQEQAATAVLEGFKDNDRGKLIMACGTGKTLTALRIAERLTKRRGLVLFLVPSINLLSQALREWTAEAKTQFNAFAVCSDTTIGKRNEDEDISITDLAYPATTSAKELVRAFKEASAKQMTVVFSTYQSIKVVSEAQRAGLLTCPPAPYKGESTTPRFGKRVFVALPGIKQSSSGGGKVGNP